MVLDLNKEVHNKWDLKNRKLLVYDFKQIHSTERLAFNQMYEVPLWKLKNGYFTLTLFKKLLQ